MYINKASFYFSKNGIKIIEEKYNAVHMGFWCTKRLDGQSWNEIPVDVFYQPNPDVTKGHTNYFGMYYKSIDGEVIRTLCIINAESAFSEPIVGALINDEVIVSRYRHDYLSRGGIFVDGGRDYLRTNSKDLVSVTVNGSEFVFERKS